jgi:hypothetical protein
MPYGQACPSAAQTYTACPDGSYVITGQACPSLAYTVCPNGSYVYSGQSCSLASQYYGTCPSGGYVIFGQSCSYSSSYYGSSYCPGVGYVPAGYSCGGPPPTTNGYETMCPSGFIAPYGTFC